MKNNKLFSYSVRILGTILLLYLLLKLIDINKVISNLQKADVGILIPSILLLFPIYLFKSLRFKLILSKNGINYSLINSICIYFSSNFLGFITPGRVGELAKSLYVSLDTNVPISQSLSSILIDRAFDILFLLFWGSISILRFDMFAHSTMLYILLFIILASLILMTLNPNIINKIASFSFFSKKERVYSLLIQYRDGLISISGRNCIFLCFLLTTLSYLFLFYQSQLLALSIGINISFADVLALISISNILSFLPISFSGLGTREFTFLYFFSELSLQDEQAIAFSFLIFIVLHIVGGLMGAIFWFVKPLDLTALKNLDLVKVSQNTQKNYNYSNDK